MGSWKEKDDNTIKSHFLFLIRLVQKNIFIYETVMFCSFFSPSKPYCYEPIF